MNRDDFREKIAHGTVMFPLASYEWHGDFNYTVNTHWHKEIEIIYFETGTFDYCCDSAEYKVEAPAMAFVNAEVLHSLALRQHQRESALVFDCKMLSYELYDHTQSAIIEPLINHNLALPPFLSPKDPIWTDALSLYRKAFSESQKNTVSSNLRVKLCLTELLSLLYENDYLTSSDPSSQGTRPTESISRALDYINNNYSENITSGDVSRHVGMNEQYFCRLFRKTTGKTLTDYINIVRINHAVELLSSTDQKIIDIGIECGYNNISYFIKRFKKIKGITPQEYRKLSHTSEHS